MHMLHDVGMTSREACFNTVRNVTACPYAGLTRHEVFDVGLMRGRSPTRFCARASPTPCRANSRSPSMAARQRLHRRAPSTTSACAPLIRDGKRGFRIVVGGGLGPLPVEARLLDEFLPVERIVNRIEAVLRVFNQYGNRKNATWRA